MLRALRGILNHLSLNFIWTCHDNLSQNFFRLFTKQSSNLFVLISQFNKNKFIKSLFLSALGDRKHGKFFCSLFFSHSICCQSLSLSFQCSVKLSSFSYSWSEKLLEFTYVLSCFCVRLFVCGNKLTSFCFIVVSE